MSTPTTAERTPTAPERQPRSVSTASSVWLVAEREIVTKVRSKSFIISTVLLCLIALGAVLWAGFQAGNASGTPIAVTSDAQSAVADIPGLEVTDVADRDAAVALVQDGSVDAAVVADANSPTGFALISESGPSTTLLLSFAQLPTVEILSPDENDGPLRMIVAFGFGFVFLLAAQTFGSTIAQSVVEEKSTRVVELLISAIPTRVLLAGKVIGNTLLAMVQIILLVAIAIVGLSVTGQDALLQGLGAPLVWFTVFFLFGFLLLAAMFAAAGAMVSRMEDIGATLTPLIFLVMTPYFLVIFFNDNPVVLTALSYVPFSAPVGMPMRLFLGEAQWWEPLASLALLIAACVVVILIGAKIYERSILRMGARVSLKEALSSKS